MVLCTPNVTMPTALQITNRRWTSKASLLHTLAEVETSGRCTRSLYLRPESVTQPENPHNPSVAAMLGQVGGSETGFALFLGDEHTVAIRPPFPISGDVDADGPDVAPLGELLNARLIIGVVLLRLGRYAVGVLEGDQLVATKTGSRHVKSRHRAGGSSQRRFERSRERLIRELFDKTCEVTQEVFSRHLSDIDYVLMGGERQTLGGLVKRCRLMQELEHLTLSRRLSVDRPGQAALDRIAAEVWKSEVVTLGPVTGG